MTGNVLLLGSMFTRKHYSLHNPSPSPVADTMDNQVSEAQLLEAEFAGGVSSGRLLYRQVDKEGRASVLHQDSLSKQLKKVGGAGQIRWWRVVGGAGQIRWWRVVGGVL